MQRIIIIIEHLSDILAKLSALVLGLMTLLILAEIFLWNIFTKTTLIADEYSAYGLAALIFLGAGYTLKEKGHIRITLVLSRLPRRLALVVELLAGSTATIFVGYITWQLMRMTLSAWRYGSTSGTLTGTPLWVPQALIVVGAVVFTLQMAVETVKVMPFASALSTQPTVPEEL
ncbi:MAG: TRAP transporter small permease [Pseudomonadota bacterium]|nr:TRAP transporter small permease [Pseudomonadota bacterium]